MTRDPELRAELPCTLEDVETFCRQFRAWYVNACGSKDPFISELLLREALGNAVRHSANPQGRVLCVVRGGPIRLLIAVRDEGRGFDWKTARTRIPANNLETSGRGLAIFYQYAHRVRFVDLGNGVTLVRSFAGSCSNKKEDRK